MGCASVGGRQRSGPCQAELNRARSRLHNTNRLWHATRLSAAVSQHPGASSDFIDVIKSFFVKCAMYTRPYRQSRWPMDALRQLSARTATRPYPIHFAHLSCVLNCRVLTVLYTRCVVANSKFATPGPVGPSQSARSLRPPLTYPVSSPLSYSVKPPSAECLKRGQRAVVQ